MVLVLALTAAGCAGRERPTPAQPPKLVLHPTSFAALDGWAADDHAAALAAFLVSCGAITKKDPDAAMGGDAAMGKVADWLPACEAAKTTSPAAARSFFETWFRPFAASDHGEARGLFTGYYEPLLHGSLKRTARFRYPLYRRPPDLVTVNLGLFAKDLAGRSVAGFVDNGKLVPYPDRAAIDGGALKGRGLEIAWVDDPVALFFLHIQGSGRIVLPDGSTIRVGYDGQNGRPYYAIGRELVARGDLSKDEVSLQTIRAWLVAHPDQAAQVMETNPSYVFFRVLKGPGPLGAEGVPLTADRSLAVDHRVIAYGVPLWLQTTLADGKAWRHLMIAQDTGGAIAGAVRGDIFFGAGPDAEWQAGHMKSEGTWAVLLPRTLAGD